MDDGTFTFYPMTTHTRRGFTIFELTIATSLLITFMYLAVRFLGGLGVAASTDMSNAAVRRDTVRAQQLVSADIEHASACGTGRTGAAVRTVAPDLLEIYTDDDGDGYADLIIWDASRGTLKRAVIYGDGTCGFVAHDTDGLETGIQLHASRYQHVLSGLAGDTVVFKMVEDGAATAVTADCTDHGAFDCLFDAVKVHVVVDNGQAGRASFERTITLSTSRTIR